MSAPAAGEVPAVGALLVAMAAAIAWLFATGALEVWRRSLGKLLYWMADTLDIAKVSILGKTFHLFGPLSKLLRSLVHTVDHYLGEAVIWSGKAASTFFGFFLSINLWMAREIADLAQDVWHTIRAQSVTAYTDARKYVDARVYRPIKQETRTIYKTSTAAIRGINLRLGRIDRRLKALAVAVPAAIVSPWPRLRGLERRAERQAKRLSRLEKASAGALAAGVVWAALRRLGLSWLRCSNTVKGGRRLCGMDPDLLDTLLAGSLILAGSISLVELARELREPTELVHTALGGLVREL